MPLTTKTTVYTMPPLYYVPSKWKALAYLQIGQDCNVLVYHDGKQKRLWGDHSRWLTERVTAGDYTQVDSPPQLKGAQK